MERDLQDLRNIPNPAPGATPAPAAILPSDDQLAKAKAWLNQNFGAKALEGAGAVSPQAPQASAPGVAPEVVQKPSILDTSTWDAGPARQNAPPSVQRQPSRYVPGGWVNGTREQSRAYGFSPEELERSRAAQDATTGFALEQRDAEIAAAKRQAEIDSSYAEERARMAQAAEAKQRALTEEKNAYVADQMAQMKARNEEIHDTKIDPEGGLHGPARMVAAIAVGLGQFGSGIGGGGPNTALAIVNSQIDRNIRAQELALQTKRDALASDSNLYAKNLAQFGDRQMAIEATKIGMLEQAKAEVDRQMANYRGNEAAAVNAAKMSKEIMDDVANRERVVEGLMHDKVTMGMNEHYRPGGYVGGGATKETGHFVPTLGGYTNNKENADKLNANGAFTMQIAANLRRIADLKKEAMSLSSVPGFGTTRLGQIEDQIAQILEDTKALRTVWRGQGAMSKGDAENSEAALAVKPGVRGKPDWMLTQELENIKSAHDRILEGHRMEGEAYGVMRGQRQYTTTPSGAVVPTQSLEGVDRLPQHQTTGAGDLVRRPSGGK